MGGEGNYDDDVVCFADGFCRVKRLNLTDIFNRWMLGVHSKKVRRSQHQTLLTPLVENLTTAGAVKTCL